jgi:hypothetical protein
MIPIIREASLIGELVEISNDRLLPYENPEEPLLPLLLRFNRFVLQADGVAFCIVRFETRGGGSID